MTTRIRNVAVVNAQNNLAQRAKPTKSGATICRNLNQAAALLAGIEAIAARGLETGKATEQDLEDIADGAERLRYDIRALAADLQELIEQSESE